jgi:O-methyltransferase involved in polyketide biosynthesis
MYLQPDDALRLIAECAARCPGGQMMFDLPPPAFASWEGRGMRTSRRYRVPPMPFSLSVSDAAKLVNTVPGIRAVHDLPYPAGRGKVLNAAMWTIQRLPALDAFRPVWTLLEFG